MRRHYLLLLAAIAGTVVLRPALAHVTLESRQAAADSNYKAVLQVLHGCKQSPTVRIRVRIPDGVTDVKPQPKPGWKLETTRGKSAKPAPSGHHSHGGGETISEVSWSGGELASEHFDEFTLLMRLPDRPGTTLHFPVVQDCKEGVHRWIEVEPKGKSAGESAAPALRLTPKR
jgi:uncharacterized protein YcnI